MCNISTYRTYCKSTRHGVDRLKSDPGNHHRGDDDDVGQGASKSQSAARNVYCTTAQQRNIFALVCA